MSARLILERLRAARRTGDRGVTLTELIVAMGLFTLIGAMSLGLFLSINSSSASTVDRTFSSASARNGIQAWTAYLRVADGITAGVKTNRIEWLAGNDMLFYADIKNRTMSSIDTTAAPTMVWLRLDSAGSLVEEQFASTATLGTAPQVCRTLVTNVTTPAGPLFTAYDAAGAAMTIKRGDLFTAPAPSTGCRPLPVTVPSRVNKADPGNLPSVTSVAIDFVVRDTKGQHPLEFKSQAVLPALGGSA